MLKQNKTKNKIVNQLIEGYNDLILDEIVNAVTFSRKYPSTSEAELIRFGQDRVLRILRMRDEAIAKLLK